jgi:hypothetical protein
VTRPAKLGSPVDKFRIAHQTKLGEILRYHKAAEGKLGAEIHPAARKQSFTQEGREDDDRE